MQKKKLTLINDDRDRLIHELKNIGVDPYALKMADKGLGFNVKTYPLSPAACNILKQEAISCGMDAAVAKGCINCSVDSSEALLLGSRNSYRKLIEKLKNQPFGLTALGRELDELLTGRTLKKLYRARDKHFSLSKTLLMGIVNTTPDSFSDGGMFTTESQIKDRFTSFLKHNVDIADVGGESTRPGSESVSAEEEWSRVSYAVKEAVKMNLPVSIDTTKSSVAENALKAGACIVNDISGLTFDPHMAKVAADYDAGVVLMHIKGTPKDMQENIEYSDILNEVRDFLLRSIDIALNAGVKEESIMIDPGFGFGKTLDDNYLLLKYMEEFVSLGFPVLAGMSRKSMIGGVLNNNTDERLAGTLALHSAAIMNGCHAVRVHDVGEARDMIEVLDKLKSVGL